jgi:prepilin-type N-terminal cleavage/methylation domain-containing protein
MRLLREESGFTLPELMIYLTIMLVLMAGLGTMFTTGQQANSNASATMASQSNLLVALNRIEYEGRCASQAGIVSSGAGVTLTLPSYCVNASGTYTWCVTGGSLTKFTGSACSGTGVTFATGVTSPTPFSCINGGRFPRLQVALTANSGTTSGTAATGTTTITLRNATLSVACA